MRSQAGKGSASYSLTAMQAPQRKKQSFDRISINVASYYEEVVLCLGLFFCHKSFTVNEKRVRV